MLSNKTINKVIQINASAPKIWDILTNPELMKLWLSEEEVNVISNWKVGGPITFIGKWHGADYISKGTILKIEKEKVFQYSYWNKFSRLPDSPENYVVIEFTLTQNGNQTMLTLTASNLINEAIFGHWNFYWTITLDIIRKLAEKVESFRFL